MKSKHQNPKSDSHVLLNLNQNVDKNTVGQLGIQIGEKEYESQVDSPDLKLKFIVEIIKNYKISLVF